MQPDDQDDYALEQRTFLWRENLQLWSDVGGGMGCMPTLSDTTRDVQNVPWSLEVVISTSLHYTLYLLKDLSKSLPLISWNCHALIMGASVFQDLLPMVFAALDQKSERMARLLCEEILSMFGVPESLLSDRVTNFKLLSNLMLDMCRMLGVNTTSYHPECDGTVE